MEIVIDNFTNNEEVTYALPLIRGRIKIDTQKHAHFQLLVQNLDFDCHCSYNSTHFKAAVPLILSHNVIRFVLLSNEGEELFTKELTLIYANENNNKMKFYYATSEDQKNRPYDNFFNEINNINYNINNINNNIELNNKERVCPIERAKEKVGVTGLLLQSSFADLLYNYPAYLPASSKRKTFNVELSDGYPLSGGVKVESLIVHKTQSECEKMNDHQLYDLICRSLPHKGKGEEGDEIAVVVMGMTRYDGETKKVYAHTALGGYPMALFGSGTIHTWSPSISSLSQYFSDVDLIDPDRLFDDSKKRRYKWANYSTAIGAMLHEIGHCLLLSHTLSLPSPSPRHTIMSRGFDYFNRSFMVSEPFFPVSSFDMSDECSLHPHCFIRLFHSRFFQNKNEKRKEKKKTSVKATVGNNNLEISSEEGIVEISIYRPSTGDVILTEIFTSFHPLQFSFPLNTILSHPLFSSENSFSLEVMTLHSHSFPFLFPLSRNNIPPVDNNNKHKNNSNSKNNNNNNNDNNKREKRIKVGAVVSLNHLLTNSYLGSNEKKFTHEGSSCFQQTFCVPSHHLPQQLPHCYWRMTSNDLFAEEELQHGDVIQLTHISSNHSLHSHAGHPSPLTSQQEVCCFHSRDENDDWILLLPSLSSSDDTFYHTNFNQRVKDKMSNRWIKSGDSVFLKHKLTGYFLHSHGGFNSEIYTSSMQEVTAYSIFDDQNNHFVLHLVD